MDAWKCKAVNDFPLSQGLQNRIIIESSSDGELNRGDVIVSFPSVFDGVKGATIIILSSSLPEDQAEMLAQAVGTLLFAEKHSWVIWIVNSLAKMWILGHPFKAFLRKMGKRSKAKYRETLLDIMTTDQQPV